ncbi:MAG: hypothetical protein AB7E61_07210 [Acholeplasmataceae bacterium]
MEKLMIQLFGDDPNDTAKKNDGDDVAGQTKTPEELAAEQAALKDAEDKAKQDAINKEQARIRRERERQEEIDNARIDAVKEAVGTNPFTDKPIDSKDDVDEYLMMKKIEKDGGDPIKDYPEYLKKYNREKYNREQKEKAEQDRMTKELTDFVTAHPDVNLEELLKSDSDFALFIRGKQGQSLENLYNDFTKIVGKYQSKITEDEKKELERLRKLSTPGSLTNGAGSTVGEFYTEDEIDAMSQQEISKNLEKVNKSLDHIRKNKK